MCYKHSRIEFLLLKSREITTVFSEQCLWTSSLGLHPVSSGSSLPVGDIMSEFSHLVWTQLCRRSQQATGSSVETNTCFQLNPNPNTRYHFHNLSLIVLSWFLGSIPEHEYYTHECMTTVIPAVHADTWLLLNHEYFDHRSEITCYTVGVSVAWMAGESWTKVLLLLTVMRHTRSILHVWHDINMHVTNLQTLLIIQDFELTKTDTRTCSIIIHLCTRKTNVRVHVSVSRWINGILRE